MSRSCWDYPLRKSYWNGSTSILRKGVTRKLSQTFLQIWRYLSSQTTTWRKFYSYSRFSKFHGCKPHQPFSLTKRVVGKSAGCTSLYLPAQCSRTWTLWPCYNRCKGSSWKGWARSQSCRENELQAILDSRRDRWRVSNSESHICGTNIPWKVCIVIHFYLSRNSLDDGLSCLIRLVMVYSHIVYCFKLCGLTNFWMLLWKILIVLFSTLCILILAVYTCCRNGLSTDGKYSFAEMMTEDLQTCRDERCYQLWINSLGIDSYVNNVFEDVRDG